MSKGVIMEKRKKYSIVMNENGQFHKTIPLDYPIGTEVNYEIKQAYRHICKQFLTIKTAWKVFAFVCTIFILLLPIYLWSSQDEPFALISIDMDSSLELVLNEDLYIESMTPLDKDAEILLSNIHNLKGSSLTTGTDKILGKAVELSMMNDLNTVIIGVKYLTENHADNIADQLDEYIKQLDNQVQVVTYNIPEEIKQLAKGKRESFNKMVADKMNTAYIKEPTLDGDERRWMNALFGEDTK